MKLLKPFLNILSRNLLWAAVLLASPTLAHAKVFDRVVARVNSDIITLSAVENRVNLLKATNAMPDASDREIQENALNTIIDNKLQVQEAERLGIEVTDERINLAIEDIKKKNGLSDEILMKMLEREGSSLDEYKVKIKNQILISKVISFQLRQRIKISEKSIKSYYLEHQKDFWLPDKIHTRHILFIFDAGITDTQKKLKRDKAEEVLSKIRRGEDFSVLAKTYSEDVSASSGGDLGVIERGKMVKEYEEAAFALRKGQVSGIVQTPFGLHIIKVEEVFPGKTKPYLEVKKEIEEILSVDKRESEYKLWLEELRDVSFIDVTLFDNFPIRKKKEIEKKSDQKTVKSRPQKSYLEENWWADEPSGSGSSSKAVKKPSRKRKSKASKRKGSTNSKPRSTRNDSYDSGYESMEKKLARIKRLRKENAITEAEYQARKKKLLSQL